MPIRDVFRTIKDLNRHELWWIVKHPFKALGVWTLTKIAREEANRAITSPDLDHDYSGGQVDAFRHILWMALITQRYGPKIARSLGGAYEKGNKLDYKKRRLEERYLPDAASMIMDFMNNEIGIEIGQRFPNISKESLIMEIKKVVLEGKAWKLKKDSKGNFLSLSGVPLNQQSWLGKWNTPKIIVPSDYGNEKENEIALKKLLRQSHIQVKS